MDNDYLIMDNDYLIIDTRIIDDFKKTTFSGYKKKDVFIVLFKSIETKKIENACNWLTECLCSGYLEETWQKLLCFSSNIITINNPNLPNYLYKKNVLLYNIVNNIDKKKTNETINLRNNQTIRNLFFSIVTIFALSSKTKRYDKYPKLKDADFNFDTISKRFTTTVYILPGEFIHYNEPEELKLVMNEIYTHLKNKIGGYEKALLWTFWIIEWEKRNIKAKNAWHIDNRDIDVQDKFKADLVWILWELIILETQNRDNFIKKQILSLYELYKFQYTSRKRNKRLPYLYQSICYLTHNINMNIPLIFDKTIYIQACINNNQMFKSKKINEHNDIVKDKEVDKKPLLQKKVETRMETEKTLDRLKIFNDLDPIMNSKNSKNEF